MEILHCPRVQPGLNPGVTGSPVASVNSCGNVSSTSFCWSVHAGMCICFVILMLLRFGSQSVHVILCTFE